MSVTSPFTLVTTVRVAAAPDFEAQCAELAAQLQRVTHERDQAIAWASSALSVLQTMLDESAVTA